MENLEELITPIRLKIDTDPNIDRSGSILAVCGILIHGSKTIYKLYISILRTLSWVIIEWWIKTCFGRVRTDKNRGR